MTDMVPIFSHICSLKVYNYKCLFAEDIYPTKYTFSFFYGFFEDDEYDADISFHLFYKRFEDSNLVVSRDQIAMEKIIGKGNCI